MAIFQLRFMQRPGLCKEQGGSAVCLCKWQEYPGPVRYKSDYGRLWQAADEGALSSGCPFY